MLKESLNVTKKKGWKILISYNNDQKDIDAFPNFGVDEVDWTYGMKNVSDETMNYRVMKKFFFIQNRFLTF